METLDQSSVDPNTAKEHLASAKRFRLGILLVHGIGTQPPRDTLVRWGDVLLKTIRRATKNQVIAMVERGRPGDGSGGQPAEVEMRICADGKDEHWLLAECWWAGSFPAPSYGELVSWSVRAVPWSIAIHIAQRYWDENSRKTGTAKLIALVRALVQLLLALALAPVFIFLLALALVLGLLPIPQLRTVILSAQSTLTVTVGDSLAFVESPVRAAFIMTRILEGLERLKETCDHTLIVAHSQGAAVVLNALGGIMESEDKTDSDARQEPLPARPVPDTLLTFGSGINQLASLKRLSAGLPKKVDSDPVNTPGRIDGRRTRKLDFNPVNVAVVALLVTMVLFGWLYTEVYYQHTTVTSILLAAAGFIGLMVIAGLLMSILLNTVTWLRSKQAKKQNEKREDWLIWATVAVLSITIVSAVIYARTLELPITSVSYLFVALLFLTGSLKAILSDEMKQVVTEGVRKPPGLARWIDLYASADPVPNGETRVDDKAKLTSVQIWNLGSLLSDHTSYWDNVDGFVLRVARECAQTAKCEWQEQLPRDTLDVDRRAAWRVGFLRLAWWGNALAWLVAFVLLLRKGYAQSMPLLFDLPTWLPPPALIAVRFALLAAAVAVVAWATFYIQCWFWTLWGRAEQAKVLTGTPPAGRPWAPLIGMGLVFVMVLFMVKEIGRGASSVVSELRANPGVVMKLLIPMIVASLILTAVACWWKPEPRPSKAPDN